MIATMKTRIAVSLVFGLAACACSRDKDAHKLVEELGSLDDAVEATVRASPNDDGLGKAEALLEAKRGSLHERLVATRAAELSPGASGALANACVKNQQNAKNVEAYVMNAALKTNPPLVARATSLAASLCELCVASPSDAWMCVNFEPREPEKSKPATE